MCVLLKTQILMVALHADAPVPSSGYVPVSLSQKPQYNPQQGHTILQLIDRLYSQESKEHAERARLGYGHDI